MVDLGSGLGRGLILPAAREGVLACGCLQAAGTRATPGILVRKAMLNDPNNPNLEDSS